MGKTVKDQLGRVVETDANISAPAVILVNPQLGENIGAACRCMLNFGLTDLRLVAPRDGWPNPAAEPMAAGAITVLENAKVYETTGEAVADLKFVLAATARRRDFLRLMLSVMVSPKLGPADCTRLECSEVSITADAEAPVQADGDIVGQLPVHISANKEIVMFA